MFEEKIRKTRTIITKETARRIRKSLEKEMKLKDIAEELEISISSARSISVKIAEDLSDEEIISVKKGRPSCPN